MKRMRRAVKSLFGAPPMTNLLIIKPSSLGDIVHGLQVAASLKAQRPELRISWIVRDIFEALVRTCEVVDRTYVFQRSEGVRGFLKLMREVRQTHFDYVFDMQGLLRTGLMTWQARAAKKVGRSDAREGATFFYQQKILLPPAAPRATPSTSCCGSAPCWTRSPSCAGSCASARPRTSTSASPKGAAGRSPS